MNIKQKINNIRKWLSKNKLDAFLIAHEDEYLSEYIPPENERLAWITGFTGSAGYAIISTDKAAIFVDGRYTVQVKDQVDSNLFEVLNIPKDSWIEWYKNNHTENSKIGYDPRMHRVIWKDLTNKKLDSQFNLIEVNNNPIDILWKSRPQPNNDKAILLEQKYTGKSSQEKRIELSNIIKSNNCDLAFITKLDSIAWILNIRGNDVPCNPVLLCHGLLHSDSSFDLFIDKNKIPEGFANHVGANVNIYSLSEISNRLESFNGKKIQLDQNQSNIWSQKLIINAGAKVIDQVDPCILPKACKNNTEINGMKKCHIRDAVAVCKFLAWLDNEVNSGNLFDEGTLSDKLDSYRSELDMFKGISFGTISAAGRNAAMCHYNHNNQNVPSMLEMDSVYLVDSGGQYLDGTTDITRTIAIGNPNTFIKKIFTLVLKGHISLSSAQFPEGIAGMQVDTFARQFLWSEGLDFNHGTGHGVGSYLNVHEGPHSIGKGANNVPFMEGMVVSNEPGYYKENEFGIRCENLIFVKKIKEVDGNKLLGFENLTYVPFDMRLLDITLITKTEKAWINKYHNNVLKKVGPLLDGTDLEWLEKSTQAI